MESIRETHVKQTAVYRVAHDKTLLFARVSGLGICLQVIAQMSSDANITIKPASRVNRSNESPEQITLNIPRANNLTFQNSFYCGAPRTFNCLPLDLRKVNLSTSQFKSYLLSHNRSLTELIICMYHVLKRELCGEYL